MEDSPQILECLTVSNYNTYLPHLVKYLNERKESFQAGCISDASLLWRKLTSDQEILDIVHGMHIEFNQLPVQLVPCLNTHIADENQIHVDEEISSLLDKKVIVPSPRVHGEFISPIFLRGKKDGSFRMVLNLKKLNRFVVYHHFKMDTIWSAVNMMKPNCYMASIDLKDAYYSVPICQEQQKFLKFIWKGKVYNFTCFPNGLALCPRKFTKLMKPAYCYLRQQGHLSVSYIDDSYLQGDDYDDCLSNTIDTIKLLDKLGFVIHPSKSVFEPKQKITFLGFILDSVSMRITLTAERNDAIKQASCELLAKQNPVIRDVAKVIGLMVSSFPGVMYGPLHYNSLEMDKIEALRKRKGNFDKKMSLSIEATVELQWWIDTLPYSYNEISHGNPNITISSDASLIGWGSTCMGLRTGGNWTPEEAAHHINYLEMLAAYFALKTFITSLANKHVKLMVDNTTVVACINKMGTCHSKLLNNLTKAIWNLCLEHNIWVTTVHIPGKHNVIADLQSRIKPRETEWSLNTQMYCQAVAILGLSPSIDLFASRLNHKNETYVSFKPDPGSIAVNAFHMAWTSYLFYAFPPFCIIQKTLTKIQQDKATGLLVVPFWPMQTWWPYFTTMLIASPILLPRSKETLYLPADPTAVHPLHKQLQLLLCHISGDYWKQKEFQRLLPTLSNSHGDVALKNSTECTSKNGKGIAVKGKWIPFQVM